MNLVDQPSADYDNVVVNGSWNGWQGWGVQLSDEDGDGVFTGSLEVDPGTTFEYVVAVTGSADGWSGWGMQWGDGCANANVAVTAGDAGSVTSTSLSAGCADVVGCMDANASNYNADATVQGYDQYGNLQCVYASCDDIPEYGCIYADGFGAFNEGFDGVACASYGGTPCEPFVEVPCPAVDFDFVNTGVNMTLFAPNGAGLSGTIGAFVGDMCVGSSESDGGPIQIAVMGDDTIVLKLMVLWQVICYTFTSKF
ncbi:MAG: hypothetical protein CM15mP23_08910 [Cryomorphaceae bacterium]|nr:MAG: hypothetical protein CM15mP23_08910 [Cryomorphaceae bacterium]